MKNKRIKPKIKYFVYSFLILLFLTLSILLIIKGINNKKQITVSYKENNDINYNVFLKPNSFFETPSLPKNSTYISSLIDYIDMYFNYNIIYDKPVTGSYTYYIKASLLANKADNDTQSYWKKEYTLKDKQTNTFTKTGNFNISENVKINYQDYNELLTSFKKEYGLAVNGNLKIELIVDSKAKYKDSKKVVENKSTMNIEVPLTQLSVDIKIDTNPTVKSNTVIVDNILLNDKKHKIAFVLGVICLLITFILFICLLKVISSYNKKKSKYHKELDRILSTYDSIIVNVDRLKDLSTYNVIEVNSFEELLDAHGEVRMPINYIELEKDTESVFILINNNVAWIYRMKNKWLLDEKD